MVKFVENRNYYLVSKKEKIPVYICKLDDENIYLNHLEKKGDKYISSDFILELTTNNKIEQRGVKLMKYTI
jgi:hypothetical protein